MEIQSNKFGKKPSKFVINRSFMIAILLSLQVLLLSISFFLLVEYIHYIYLLNFLVSLIIVVYIVNRQGCPEFKIVWLTFMCLLPIFGISYYLFIELNPKLKIITDNVKKIRDDTAYLLGRNQTVLDKIEERMPRYMGILKFLQKQGPYPVYDCTDVEYYDDGEKSFEAIKTALRNANSYIFMEYYVVSPGKLLDEVVDILKDKAAAGIEVRLMYDGLCHAKTLSYDFPKQMREYGIKINIIEPFSPFLSADQNYRDHRKMTVVDGVVAFTGGFNLADEYVNFSHPFGHWKDVGIRIIGDAVKTYTVLFLQNWHLDGLKEKEIWEDYIKINSKDAQEDSILFEEGFVTPYADSPNVGKEIGEMVYIDILNQAKDYVWIMTPYLILDSNTVKVISYVADRGIDIKIIIPHIPDKKIPFLIAKSFYPELIKSGVKIYEYMPGFIHAKLFVSDNIVATIGSYNLDYRSFYLNYEVGMLILDSPEIKDISEDYKNTLLNCHKVSMADYKGMSLISRILGKILRILGPLM